jgi:hypothetical protein
MMYTTRFSGTPYGMHGEEGPVTRSPARTARKCLQAGQRLDAFRVDDPEQTTPVMRFESDPQGRVSEINVW